MGCYFSWNCDVYFYRLIVDRCDCGLSRWLGEQEFSIPQNVLDIVYAQTVGW